VAVLRTALAFLLLHRTYLTDDCLARDAWMILTIDFVLMALWVIGQWRRRVTWRGEEFVIRAGRLGRVEEGARDHS